MALRQGGRHLDVGQGAHTCFVVLADPDGIEFAIYAD
jgi:hypothetical protein